MKFDFFKNKVFIISFIVLILFSFFVSSGVYAYSIDDVTNDMIQDAINYGNSNFGCSNFIIFTDGDKLYCTWLTSSDSFSYVNNNRLYFSDLPVYTSTAFNNGHWNTPYSFDGSYDHGASFTYFYSVNNIYTDSSKSTVFFQTPPRVVVPEIAEVRQIPVAMVKVLKVILPVGLIVLAIGLLIYLTRRVIFLMK